VGFQFLAPAFAQQPGGGSQGGGAGTQTPGATANGPASPTTPETMPTPAIVDDKKFLKEAAQSGMAEVELAKIAEQKASSDQVKQFAQRLVADHTKANDQLKQIASRQNVNIPDELGKKYQSKVDKLNKLSGADFDKAYVKDQVKDHKDAVSEFKSESQNGTVPEVQQFASQTLPTLEQHLDLAKNLSKSGKTVASSETK
jgi:putative membrane protein